MSWDIPVIVSIIMFTLEINRWDDQINSQMIWLFDIIMPFVDVHLKYIGVYLFSFKYLSNKMSLLVQMLTSTMMKTES